MDFYCQRQLPSRGREPSVPGQDREDLHIVTFFVGCLLSHQNVVLFSSIFLPVGHLLSICLHLLEDRTGHMSHLSADSKRRH